MNISKHFEFEDWHKCFAYFDEMAKQEIKNLRLVISTHWASEGYWIENTTEEVSSEDYVYTPEEVPALMERVKDGIEQAKIQGMLGPGLIL